MERKSLSKKIRFEVFKRDSFTCQYCGQKAPDVVLEVDHIKPVSKGGVDEIINLVTSCTSCNRGKTNIELSDNSIVTKQRRQIEELNIKKQQLEMILEWRDGLAKNKEIEFKKASEYWNSKIDYSLTDAGKIEINKLVEKFGLISVMDAIDLSIQKYGQYSNTKETAGIIFSKIGGILHYNKMPEHKQKISYIKGICRNKFDDFDEKTASILLNKYYDLGYELEFFQKEIQNDEFKSWRHLMHFLNDLLNS